MQWLKRILKRRKQRTQNTSSGGGERNRYGYPQPPVTAEHK